MERCGISMCRTFIWKQTQHPMLQHQMQHTNAMSYRPPNGQIDLFEKIFKYVFSITKNSNKVHYNVENFNLNLLDHENNRKIQDFLLSIIFSAMAL